MPYPRSRLLRHDEASQGVRPVAARLPSLLLLAALSAGGCDSEPPAQGPVGPPPVAAPSASGVYWGQEVWLTYTSPEHAAFGAVRIQRSRDEARRLAESLRDGARSGTDVGALARQHSNAPGGVARGYCQLPRDPDRLDERDHAMMVVHEGEVTELVDWLGGWWFAKRVGEEQGRALRQRFEDLRRTEARGVAIVLHHKEAYPFRRDQKRTREQARAEAAMVHARAVNGEDFADLARQFSSDEWGAFHGGELRGFDPATKTFSPWLKCTDPYHPNALLDVLMDGPPGVVHPTLLDTGWGFVIVKPLERRRVEPPPAPR